MYFSYLVKEKKISSPTEVFKDKISLTYLPNAVKCIHMFFFQVSCQLAVVLYLRHHKVN